MVSAEFGPQHFGFYSPKFLMKHVRLSGLKSVTHHSETKYIVAKKPLVLFMSKHLSQRFDSSMHQQ